MTTINATKAGKDLRGIIEHVSQSHTPVHIAGRNGAAVLISEEDWEAIQETLYLSQFPGMVKSIKEGMKEPLDKCKTKLAW